TIYAAVNGGGINGNSGGTGIWKSTDGGVTWINTTQSINSTNDWSDLVIDPTSPNILYAALAGGPATGVYLTSTRGTGNNPWTLVSALPSGGTTQGAGNPPR